MNRPQMYVLVGTVAAVLLMLLFPPISSRFGAEGYEFVFREAGRAIT
jgi:hypothetical protein